MPDNLVTQKLSVPIEWNIPSDVVARYATNMVIQKMEAGYLISFFEILPPLIIGQPVEISEQIKQIKSVRANCTAQVIISDTKMLDVVKAFNDSVKPLIEEINSHKEEK